MKTLGDLVEFVLRNRKGKAFANYSELDIASSILDCSRNEVMHYLVNSSNCVCGIVIATKDIDNKVMFVREILTTEGWAFKEFVKLLLKQYSNFKLQAQRYKGAGKLTPRFVNYNTNRLIQLSLKGT